MSHFTTLFQLLCSEENIIIIIHCIFSPTKDLVIIVSPVAVLGLLQPDSLPHPLHHLAA